LFAELLEAMDTIRRRWTEIIDQFGPTAIMPYSYLGTEGILNGLNVGDALFNKLGAGFGAKPAHTLQTFVIYEDDRAFVADRRGIRPVLRHECPICSVIALAAYSPAGK
jgi:hypothetical protein